MINPLSTISILAQSQKSPGSLVDRAKLDEVSDAVNDGNLHDLPWELLLIGLGTTLICIVIVTLRRWWHARQDDPSPLVLYSAIARKAGLSLADRFTLWRIAKASDLPTPIALLLARGTLRHYTLAYTQRRSPQARQRIAERIARIEAELFG